MPRASSAKRVTSEKAAVLRAAFALQDSIRHACTRLDDSNRWRPSDDAGKEAHAKMERCRNDVERLVDAIRNLP